MTQSGNVTAAAATPRWSTGERTLLVTTVLVLLASAYVALRFADQPLIEAHGFRQTQTALTAYWFLREGLALAYQTPVAGAPWSIPFEVPIYQGLVAGAAALTGAPLSAVGRILSWLFLVASIPSVLAIGRRLKVDRSVVLAFLSLWLSSPLYLFWGRTFMIETAALFFSLAALPFAIDLIDGDTSPRSAGGAGVFLTLAMLQKVTTAAPLLLVVGSCWLFAFAGRLRRPPRISWRDVTAPLAAFGLPLLVVLAWTRYADAVKKGNALGSQLTSDLLHWWQFGDLNQRLSSELLVDVLWNRLIHENAGGAFGLALIAGAALFGRDLRLRRLVLACLIAFILPVLVFTNVHIVHTYYQMACGLYGAAALALAVGAWLPSVVRHPLTAPGAIIVFVALNLGHFRESYWTTLQAVFPVLETRSLAVAEVLKRYTPLNSAFVAFGCDWSSEVAYHSGRKAFTVPDWFLRIDEAWSAPERFVGDTKLGAIVGCPSLRGPSQDQILDRFETERTWLLVSMHGCRILINDDRIR